MTTPNDTPRHAPNARDCEHGRLARSCEICERDREIAELREQLEKTYEDGKRNIWELNQQLAEAQQKSKRARGALADKEAELATAHDSARMKDDRIQRLVEAAKAREAQVRALLEALERVRIDLECIYDINGCPMTDSDAYDIVQAALVAAPPQQGEDRD